MHLFSRVTGKMSSLGVGSPERRVGKTYGRRVLEDSQGGGFQEWFEQAERTSLTRNQIGSRKGRRG